MTIARYFGDRDAKVKAHAVERLQTIPHRGGQRCLVISNAGWRQVHRVIYNDKAVFFLGPGEYGTFSPEAPEGRESYEPFFVAADRISEIFVHRGSIKLEGIGKAEIHGLYLVEAGKEAMGLLVLPLRDYRDELELHDWGPGDSWLDDMVSGFHGRGDKGAAAVRTADELMGLVDQKYLSPPWSKRAGS